MQLSKATRGTPLEAEIVFSVSRIVQLLKAIDEQPDICDLVPLNANWLKPLIVFSS
jgi:hypothetical protein